MGRTSAQRGELLSGADSVDVMNREGTGPVISVAVTVGTKVANREFNLVPANYACALITFLDAECHILGCKINNNYAHLSKVSGPSYNVHFIVRVTWRSYS